MLTNPQAGYVYLASPHTSPDPIVVKQREDAVIKTTAQLVKLGLRVFSPIVHSHILVRNGADLEHGEWMLQDQPLLANASLLLVLCLPGWEDSKGIRMEIEFFQGIHRPIFYLSQDFGANTVFFTRPS